MNWFHHEHIVCPIAAIALKSTVSMGSVAPFLSADSSVILGNTVEKLSRFSFKVAVGVVSQSPFFTKHIYNS